MPALWNSAASVHALSPVIVRAHPVDGFGGVGQRGQQRLVALAGERVAVQPHPDLAGEPRLLPA